MKKDHFLIKSTSKRKSRKLTTSKSQHLNVESPKNSTESIRKTHRKSVSDKIFGLFKDDKEEEPMQVEPPTVSGIFTFKTPLLTYKVEAPKQPVQMRKWVVKSAEKSVSVINKPETSVLLDSKGEPKPNNNNNNIKFFRTYHGPKLSRGDSVTDRIQRYSEQITRSNSKEIYRKKSDSNKDLCVAQVDVESAKEGDLSFKMGDMMVILEKHKNGWWECEKDGTKGWVSSKYVKELRTRSATDFV